MAFEKNEDELGALWIKHGPKSDYMTGEINGQKVVVFQAKKTSDKSPDWRVLKSRPRTETPPDRHPGKPVEDTDIPF